MVDTYGIVNKGPLVDDGIPVQGFAGSRVRFSPADDTAWRIDNVPSGALIFVVVTPYSGDNRQANGIVTQQAGIGSSTFAGGGDFAHIGASDTPPTGTSGTDAKLNFQARATGGNKMFWVENRLGQTVDVCLYFLAPVESEDPVTATNIT